MEGGLPQGTGPEGAFETKTLNAFDKEATCARLDTLGNQRLIGKGGQDNHRRLRVALCDGPADLNTAYPWQPYVEQNHVRMQACNQLVCLLSVGSITHDLKVVFLCQHRFKPLTHHLMIIDDH